MSAARRAIAVCCAGLVLVVAYAFSFVFAQATPEPHELPVAVAGARAAQAQRRIERAAGESFAVRRVDGAGAARQLIRDRKIYGALVVGAGRPRLLTAPAAGESAVDPLQMKLPQAAGVDGTPSIEQVRALVSADPEGRALELTITPLVILGLVVPLMLTVIAAALPVRDRTVLIAGFAAVAGPCVVLVVHSALGAVPGPFVPLAALAALALFAVAATVTALIAVLGPPGAGVGILLLLVVGNVGSGAGVVRELQPGLWRVVGGYLPPGAAADALRGVAYFDGAALLRPVLVLTAFAVAATGLDLVLGDRRPAGQGDPSGPTTDHDAQERLSVGRRAAGRGPGPSRPPRSRRARRRARGGR